MISTQPSHGAIGFPSALVRLVSATWLVIPALPAMATDLTGVVLGTNGDPAAGVTVTLSTSPWMSIAQTVLSETATDGGGHFRITVPDDWFDIPATLRQDLSLTVKSPGQENGGIIVYRELPLPRDRLTIRLEPWTKRKILLQSADNKPLAGVRVRLTGLHLPAIFPPYYVQPPERQTAAIPLGALQSAGTTDDSGMAELVLPPIESVAAVEAEIEKDIIVNWSVYWRTAVAKNWSEKLHVPELKRVPVEVTFGDRGTSDLNLTVTSNPRASYGPTTTIRHAVDLDSDGKATAVVQDEAILYLLNSPSKPTELQLSQTVFEDSTRLERLCVSFSKGVRITGRAVSTDGEPAAGTRLTAMIVGNRTMLNVSTDADGRFDFAASAGPMLLVPAGRSGYRARETETGPKSVIVVPKARDAHDLGDVVFTRLKSLKGVVRDEAGKAVGGAIVTAIWDEPNPLMMRQATICREELIVTNEDGSFTIPGLDPRAEPMLAAQHGVAMTERLQSFSLEKPDAPVSLTISRAAAIGVSGCVADHHGKGIGGLEVTLRHRLKPPIAEAQAPRGADVDGIRLVTDQDGNYATPTTLPPWGEFVALIRTGTKREAISGWKPARPGATLVLPTIEDSRISEITGRIVTAEGTPLPKARVLLLTSDGQEKAQPDEDGKFTIELPAGRMPLLIAEADGLMANGTPIEGGQTSLQIELPRTDELPLRSHDVGQAVMPQPARWTVERKRELAVRLADGLADSDPQTKTRVDAALARHLPDRILNRLDSLPPSTTMQGQMIRSSLAAGLAEDRPQEGLRVLDALPDGAMKLHMLIRFERAAKLRDDDRLQLLARIVQDARGIREAEHRVGALGLAGERLLDLGQRASGEALLRESLKDAKQLSPAAFSGYARGAFAEELAQIDANAALELIKPLTEAYEFNRHLRNIAHELATLDPDRAIAILDRMRAPDENHRPIADERELAALRVCYRMIRVAPDKAMQLGRSIQHISLRPYSFYLMAESLLCQDHASDADQALAGRLHDEAWQMLAEVRRENDLSKVAYLYPSTVAALLLGHTAKLAPPQLPHRIWQTIALRRPIEKSGPYEMAGLGCTCEMALLLANVDRNRAREVARWLPSPSAWSSGFLRYVQGVRTAADLIAELHPEQCEAALEAITDARENQFLRLALVKALLPAESLRARSIRRDLGLWFPDDEDTGPIE